MPRPKKAFARITTQPYRPTDRQYNPKTDKRWAVVYPHPDRLKKLKTETFRTETEAIAKRDELNAKYNKHETEADIENWTIADTIDFWIRKKANKLISADKEVARANYIKNIIGEIFLYDLKERHYEKLSEYIQQDETRRTKTNRGYDAYFITLRTALNYTKSKYPKVSFPALSDFILNDYEARERIATEDELQKLYDACFTLKSGQDRRHLAIIITWLHETSCRSGELKTIKVKDIDLDKGIVKIRQSKRKKSDRVKYRDCGISPKLQDMILESNLLEYPDETLVIAEPLGFKKAIDFKRSFATACRIAKIDDLHIHDLRATGITNMLERGIPLPLVAKMVGHEAESAMTLKVYTRFREQFIKQEMQKLA
jgi:integrase